MLMDDHDDDDECSGCEGCADYTVEQELEDINKRMEELRRIMEIARLLPGEEPPF